MKDIPYYSLFFFTLLAVFSCTHVQRNIKGVEKGQHYYQVIIDGNTMRVKYKGDKPVIMRTILLYKKNKTYYLDKAYKQPFLSAEIDTTYNIMIQNKLYEISICQKESTCYTLLSEDFQEGCLNSGGFSGWLRTIEYDNSLNNLLIHQWEYQTFEIE